MNNLLHNRFIGHPAVALILIGLLAGCQTTDSDRSMSGGAATDIRPAAELVLLDGGDGSDLSWDELVAQAADADVVFIGELHGHPVGLPAAATLWERVTETATNAALCLEFFERDQQVAIDDYLAGVTDEEAFREASGRTRGSYPAGHRMMVERAREMELPVYAANAPRRYVRLARTDGYDKLRGLGWEQRRLYLVPAWLQTDAYRDRFFEVMGAMGDHSSDEGEEADGAPDEMMEEEEPAQAMSSEEEERIGAIFRSQSVWDATMADTVLEAYRKGHRPIFLVVGQFHTNFGGGIPLRLSEREPEIRMLTVSMINAWSDELREEDQGMADRILYVGPIE